MRRVLVNRFALTLLVFISITGAWYAMVAVANDGIVEGLVVDARSAPVVGAAVYIDSKEIDDLSADSLVAKTDSRGRFRFERVTFFHFTIRAELSDLSSPTSVFHLYWRSQNFELPDPIVLADR